ncbi:MAG: hypothetical protein LBG17_09680 [Bacteroidales bacterium]|nr:hypothetical protein [Bacteroidales bacterium]
MHCKCAASDSCKQINISSKLVENRFNALVVTAKVNNSIPADFMLDSGLAEDEDNGGITVDSAFFYKYIDTTNLIRVKPRIRMYYWYTYYRGDIPISIGDHTFYVHNIKVRNQSKKYENNNNIKGIICHNAFVNKITIVNFDKNTISFSDTLPDVANYIAIPLYPPKQIKNSNFNEKYIEIGGFRTANGKKKKGRFLFDTGNFGTGIVFKYSFAKDIPVNKDKALMVKSGYNKGENEWMWRIDSLSISDSVFLKRGIVCNRLVKEPIVDYLDMLVGGDGLLGIPFLKRFNFIADYKNNVLYLSKEPTTWYKEITTKNDMRNKKKDD